MNIKKLESPKDFEMKPILDGIVSYGLAEVNGIEPMLKAVVLEIGKETVGGATGKVHFNQFYLDNLWVQDQHGNMGYGSKIHAAVIEVAKENQCDCIRLQTLNEKAVTLYKRLGYSVEAKLSNYVEGFNLYHMLLQF